MTEGALFVLLLQIGGFSKKEAKKRLEEFLQTKQTMEEFSKENLLDQCKTLFLRRILLRFSKVYDDKKMRARIINALEKGWPDIKGDLHIHTSYSDGTYPIESYVREAEYLGYKYIAITDHSLVNKGIVQMDEKSFLEETARIYEIQSQTSVKILKGIEIDVNEDGKLDYSKEILKRADVVLGAVHFDYKMGSKKALELLKVLLKNECIDIIAHPLNKIEKRDFVREVDEVVRLAQENKKAFEINLALDRMGENDFLVEILKDADVRFSIGTDSHSFKQMELMPLANLWIDEIKPSKIANFYDDPTEFLKS